MKNNFLLSSYALLTFFIFSCSEKNDSGDVLLNTDNIDLPPVISAKGQIPDNHPINTMMFDVNNQEMIDVDKMYKTSIADCKTLHYCSNLKNFGFKLVVETGLIIKGTNEQKKFYLDEQMSIDANLINFYNFYNLLASCKNFMDSKALNDYSNMFYKKNIEKIESLLIEDAKKIEFINSLKRSKNDFTDMIYN